MPIYTITNFSPIFLNTYFLTGMGRVVPPLTIDLHHIWIGNTQYNLYINIIEQLRKKFMVTTGGTYLVCLLR